MFGPGSNGVAQPAVDVKSLHAKIGELTLENDFFEGALTKAGIVERKAMIDRERSTDRQAGGSFEHQPWQRLLPATAGVGR